MLSIIPGHASIANQVFAKFISRLPHKRSKPTHPQTPKSERMKTALSTLAKIMGDESIANRDPMSSLSFCCLPTDVVNKQMDMLVQFRKKLKNAVSPLGPDGRPLRRYVSQTLLLLMSDLFAPDILTGRPTIGFMARRMDCLLRVNLNFVSP